MVSPNISNLINKWADCAQDAEQLGVEHTHKLIELRKLSEELMAAIDDKLSQPTISLEGLEIDG
jgi:hypothetical protein